MKRLILLAISLALVAGLLVPSAAIANNGGATVDVIALAEGSTDALVAHIQSLGGTVKFQYRNVPAVAATIPAGTLAEVSGFSGVTSVQKDQMVYLTEGLDSGKNAGHPMSYAAEGIAGVEVKAVEPAAFDPGVLPEGYANFLYTGAIDVWGETGAGEGTIVAVIDTGTVPNTCIGHAVIGAPGFPDGYNSSGDGIPATSPLNHWHGTHVGGVIASSCSLDFSAAPTHPIYLGQAPYLGWPVDFVPILGQAPAAKLYPVKVFPASGAGVPTSFILEGFDHVLTLKTDGLLDVDIVNLSAGGPTGWDGRDAYDRFMEEMVNAGILVVTSAGNEGPIPNSVGSPGTSFDALTVGAMDYAPSSRAFYEYLGHAVFGAPGQGLVMRPTAETRVVNFSSRGPLSDGRFGPEIVALGHWTFHEGPNAELRWAGGTSFSSPTVAGGAALLNAWWEAQGNETDPVALENVLKLGADPTVVGPVWQEINDQGYGTLDVPAAFVHLQNGDVRLKPAKKVGELTANVLGPAVPGKKQTWTSKPITLNPSESFDAVFEVTAATSNVTIEVFDIVAPDNSAYAYWPNALEVHLQSAKRTSFGHPVEVYWYPFAYGDAFDIVVEDGPWTFWGMPWDNTPMEPGLMKLSLIGDYSNEDPVSFRVRIRRENFAEPLQNRVANGVIKDGDSLWVPVEIPEGAGTATFDLTWHRDWSMFPTSDVDMILFDPNGALASFAGATGNAPERAIIDAPLPGTWYVLIDGYEIYKPDNWDLFLNIE
jgi:serine protease AprX